MTTATQLSMSVDYHVVPGTVYIVEAENSTEPSGTVRLIPHPSNDLRDPLRWPKWRKYYHLSLLVAYSTLLGAVTQWESPIWLVLVEVFRTDISTLNLGRALTILMLGVGNVFLTPLSDKFGRRSVYLFSLLTSILAYVWMSLAHNAGEFIGAHVLLGIGAAPFEALPANSIADVFFAHERGTMLSWYVFGLAFGSFVGPICSGYIFPAMGFRWIYRWGAILLAILLVVMYFTMEESRCERVSGAEASGSVEEALNAEAIAIAQGSVSKLHEGHVESLADDDGLSSSDQPGQNYATRGFRLQWRPFRVFSGTFRNYCGKCFRPLLCFWYPGILWTGINYGSCVSWLAVLGSTTASIFAPPPYLFGSDALGLIWLSTLIGSLLGAIYSGPINDMFVLWLARRNRGWREPEFRLWFFLSGALIMPAGLILYGVGAAAKLHWIAPVIGMGMVGFGLSIGGTVGISYVIDCYRDIDGEAVTTVILIRNVIGFGVTFGIEQWIQGMGLRDCFIMIGCLAFAITGFAAVMIALGKRWRKVTESAYRKLVADIH